GKEVTGGGSQIGPKGLETCGKQVWEDRTHPRGWSGLVVELVCGSLAAGDGAGNSSGLIAEGPIIPPRIHRVAEQKHADDHSQQEANENDEPKRAARAANPLHGWSPQTVSYRITSYYFQGKDLSGLVSE